MLHAEIEQTGADLADTGLQRPKRTKKDTVDTPQTDKITVPSSSTAEPDTEALMETTECPPPQSIAEDLTCKYLFFSICMYVCLYIYLSVCLSIFKYVFHYLILSVEACMEIVKDQGEHATAGWTGFQNKPTSKETAQRAVDLLVKKWFYTEVIIFLTGDTLPDSLLYMLKLKINFTSEKKEDPTPTQSRRRTCSYTRGKGDGSQQ